MDLVPAPSPALLPLEIRYPDDAGSVALSQASMPWFPIGDKSSYLWVGSPLVWVAGTVEFG